MPPASTTAGPPLNPAAAPPTDGWRAELVYRFRRHLVVKLLGVTAWTSLFFIGYFYLLRNPAYPVTVMPLTAVDHAMPFVPQALVAYLSLWFYVGIAPGLQRSFAELVVYGLWAGALCLAGLGLFYFWPTQIPPLPLDAANHPGFALLKGVDAAGNACPSMHVAIAMFTVIRLEELLRSLRAGWPLRLVNLVWFLAIALSTLAVKQHVALDVIAGAALGTAFALPSLRWRPRSA